MDLHSVLIEEAQKEGFPLAGSVDLDLASQAIQPHIAHFDQWLAAGYAGKMDYIQRGRDRRADPRLLFPQAQSIFCVAMPYPKQPAGAENSSKGPRYARYLQGPDYHIEITEKLERVMQAVNSRLSAAQKSPLIWKVCVDTSAVLERSWAELCGLGWIGKNTLLIHPRYGSYLFLGEVLLSASTGRAPSPLPNYCGNCNRCLTTCPTQALPSPRVLDSNRCISYSTLEKRGDLALPKEQKEKFGNWIAGCDICQEVCPFNRKPTQEALCNGENIPKNISTELNQWEDLLREDSNAYRERVRHSALKRIKPEQFSRNLAMSLMNSLIKANHEEFGAMKEKLGSLIRIRLESETDLFAKSEWERCQAVIDS